MKNVTVHKKHHVSFPNLGTPCIVQVRMAKAHAAAMKPI